MNRQQLEQEYEELHTLIRQIPPNNVHRLHFTKRLLHVKRQLENRNDKRR